MGKALLDMAISLDNSIDGPDGADVGLYGWYAAESGPNADVAAETVATTGAIVVGRGVLGRDDDAKGWDETPYDVPHFVVPAFTSVRHRAVRREGGRPHHRRAHARQALVLGLVDEVQFHLVPVIVGAGTLLFAPGAVGWRLVPIRVVEAPGVTHLRYRVDGPSAAAEG